MRSDTLCVQGVWAIPLTTCSAGSKSSGTSKLPGRTAGAEMRSSLKLRISPLLESAPVTYQRPEWATIPYGKTMRSLGLPPRSV
jgi:hypothetical protein